MNIIERNFNAALESINELVEKEKKEGTIKTEHIIVQAAYNDASFELYSAALSPCEDGLIPDDMAKDSYYNMVFVADNFDEIPGKFRNKYLFKLAYADISCALEEAYNHALRTETGEYTLHTSFNKPSIEDSSWAYDEVFQYSDYGNFRCWFNFDEKYENVDIQADTDLIIQYEETKPAKQSVL